MSTHIGGCMNFRNTTPTESITTTPSHAEKYLYLYHRVLGKQIVCLHLFIKLNRSNFFRECCTITTIIRDELLIALSIRHVEGRTSQLVRFNTYRQSKFFSHTNPYACHSPLNCYIICQSFQNNARYIINSYDFKINDQNNLLNLIKNVNETQ